MNNIDQVKAQAMIDREVIGYDQVSSGTWRHTSRPSPMSEVAYHGIVGEIVRTELPHTEASHEALLVDALAQLGNAVGSGPRSSASGSSHGTNDYFVLVGPTGAAGRKGSSHGHNRELMKLVDPHWTLNRVQGGLSSGEGMIHHVRDPLEQNGQVIEEGISDKRLFCYEPEMAQILAVMDRTGSILSTQLRQAWDSGTLRVMTKNTPSRATGAHISLLAHVTPEELVRCMTSLQAANGYGNRHLWIWAQRSKLLPEGGGNPILDPLVPKLRDILDKASRDHYYQRSESAKEAWADVYPELTKERSGMAGTLCARNDAHALRLQVLFAALDGTDQIEEAHVRAALEIIRYSEDTIQFIFGDKTGDKNADLILSHLRKDGRIPRTGLHLIFKNNISSGQLQRALDILVNAGLASSEQVTSESGGIKPVEVWKASSLG